jgi:pimeloyl-ACP methyl ester carboxylesterase
MPFLPRDGCQLYYETHGAGPALVFAHGLGGGHLSWWQQVPHFRDRYTCVTFDHRGSGSRGRRRAATAPTLSSTTSPR